MHAYPNNAAIDNPNNVNSTTIIASRRRMVFPSLFSADLADIAITDGPSRPHVKKISWAAAIQLFELTKKSSKSLAENICWNRSKKKTF